MKATTTLAFAVVLVGSGLAGCGQQGPDGTSISTKGEASETITPRAIVAIALQHLDPITKNQSDAYVDEEAPQSTIAAEIRYDTGEEADDGDLVEIGLVPREDAQEFLAIAQGCDAKRDCIDLGDDTYLLWDEVHPESDPGYVLVLKLTENEVVYVYTAGANITGDPRKLDLLPSVETLQEVLADPLLRLKTTPAAIQAGEEIEEWGDGSEPG